MFPLGYKRFKVSYSKSMLCLIGNWNIVHAVHHSCMSQKNPKRLPNVQMLKE